MSVPCPDHLEKSDPIEALRGRLGWMSRGFEPGKADIRFSVAFHLCFGWAEGLMKVTSDSVFMRYPTAGSVLVLFQLSVLLRYPIGPYERLHGFVDS